MSNQGQGGSTPRKQEGFARLFRQCLYLSRGALPFAYWHLDLNAGEGPKTSAQVWAWAQEQGLTETTLNRAKRALDIRTARPWANGQPQCYWLLEGQQMPTPTPPGGTPDAIDQWLQELRDQYPGPPAPDSL